MIVLVRKIINHKNENLKHHSNILIQFQQTKTLACVKNYAKKIVPGEILAF